MREEILVAKTVICNLGLGSKESVRSYRMRWKGPTIRCCDILESHSELKKEKKEENCERII